MNTNGTATKTLDHVCSSLLWLSATVFGCMLHLQMFCHFEWQISSFHFWEIPFPRAESGQFSVVTNYAANRIIKSSVNIQRRAGWMNECFTVNLTSMVRVRRDERLSVVISGSFSLAAERRVWTINWMLTKIGYEEDFGTQKMGKRSWQEFR